MTETLLSISNVLLFGRVVEDLKVQSPRRELPLVKRLQARVATTDNIAGFPITGTTTIDGVVLAANDVVLVKNQNNRAQNGLWTVNTAAAWARSAGANATADFDNGFLVEIAEGQVNRLTLWELAIFDGGPLGTAQIRFAKLNAADESTYKDNRHGPFSEDRSGAKGHLEEQLTFRGRQFARIYGFSFEGSYYELPSPTMFLVHGEGADAAIEFPRGIRRRAFRSRAPGDPSLTGLAAADFQFAEDVKVWSYDKADYTIRMDVSTGMFEQLLLDNYFDDTGISTRLAGAKVAGAKVSGAKVSGAKVSGAKLSGRWDPSD